MKFSAKCSVQSEDDLLQLRSRIAELERDLSEVLAERDALGEEKTRYQRMLESISDVIFEIDDQGVVLYFSPTGKDIWGYNQEDVIGKNYLELVHPDDRDIMIKRFIELSAGREYPLIYRIKNKSNEFKWVRTNTKPRIEKGVFIGAIGTLIDVTDQKLMEEALRESEVRYRAISEYSHQAICIVDERGKITWGNDKMQALGGYSLEQMYGAESFAGFIAPESIEFVLSNFFKVLAGESYEHYYTFHFIRADGEKRLCEKYMTDFKDKNEKRNLIISMVDITDSKRAEAKLRQQTAAMEAAIDGIAILNEEEEYVYLNKSHANLYGYESAGELLGKSWRILYGSDVLQHFDQEVMPELSRKGDWHGESVGMKKNGTTFPQELSLTAMADGGLICVVREITERKLLESQLLQAQKMEAIGTLSGGIAHDFNNVLSAMIGYTELAMMEDDIGHRQDDLKQVLQACERATSLVSQILTFSRKSAVDKKPLNIGYIVKEAVKLLRATIPATIEIKQQIDSKSMIALANSTQIHQVMMNLCTNAAHAMRKNGGVMEIKLTPIEIACDSQLISLDIAPGTYLKLEVGDMGHGIDPAHMNRIFDPFFTTKGVSEGTGLGLSVVYGIVKGHGGAITVDSIPGSGSLFTVYIPSIPQQESKVETETGVIHRGNEAILFVDDEPMLSALGRSMLQKSGYKVTDSTDSVQALEIFADNPSAYDLIITDMAMPCITGIDLAREIWKIRPQMPVILCTGHSDLIDAERAKQEGIRRFIMKPLRRRELARAVRDVLDEQ